MSNQFYDYLTSKVFDYFSQNKFVKGERYYIQLDEENQIIDFYNSIKNYGLKNNIYGNFHYQHEKGDEFSTFFIECSDINLVVVESTSISENYLVTLRNEIPKQEGVWKNTALLAIVDESIDSVFEAMGNLGDSGKPLNINYISSNLEDEIDKNKELKKSYKEILKFSINILNEDVNQTTIWDYENILSIIKSGKVTSDDLRALNLFPDNNLEELTAHNMSSRLKENHALYDEIDNYHRYDDVEDELKKSFTDKGVKQLSKENWYLTDYKDVISYIKKDESKKLRYEENLNKVTAEGLIYWEKPLASTPSKKRNRQILVFNDKNVDSVSFKFSFDQDISSKFLLKNSDCNTRCFGKTLSVKFNISPNEPTFKQIVYKHNNKNNSLYTFNILVLNSTPSVFNSIKSRYSIGYSKKLLLITNDETSDDVILGTGKNLIEYEVENNGDKINLYEEDSILISDNSPALEEGFINFWLSYNNNDLRIEVKENSKPIVPVNSSVIWNLKRQNKENFVYNGGKAIQGVYSANLEYKFREYLDLEREIIDNNVFYGKLVGGKIEKIDVQYSEELTNAYRNILNYYKTFDDTPEDNLPSLVYLNDELKKLYENFLEIFNKEIQEINENDVLADFDTKKDLIKLGRIDDDNRIMYSSLSPINIAYQLEIINQCGTEEFSNNLAERLVPNNLIPYLYSDSDELYRPIYQEDAHEWLFYEKNDDVSIGTTNAFISKVVSEKLNQFVKHFRYLFKVNKNAPIKINLINIKDDIEVVKGVFSFIRDRLPDKKKNKNIIPVEINIYNDSNKSNFETLFNCTTTEKLDKFLGIKIDSDLLDEMDILHYVQNNINYYHNSLNDEFKYAHISFYKVDSGIEVVFENMDKMETGLSLNALISTVASTTKYSDYRTGFGTKNILNKEDLLVKSAININEIIENSKMNGKNPYSKNKSIVTSITLDDENIEKLYKKSHWVTFIEPPFGLEFFENPDNLIIIHYSDQYTSSNKYDTITVTDKTPQYEEAINRFFKEKDIVLSPEELNPIIRMFNSINGEWLLNLVSSPGEYDREKLSIISAVKYALSLFNHEDIIWIPISLEEILRISKNLKLDKTKGSFSSFIKQGSYSDDLLLIGLNIKDENNLELMYYPIEVKVGLNARDKIDKGISQIKSTYDLLNDMLDDKDSKFRNKFFRNFFIQLFLSNQQKLVVNEIWDEKEFNRIEKFKSKLLNDDYTINYGLKDYIGKGTLFSFKNSCNFQSITFEDNIQIIELPEENVYKSLSKSLNDLYNDIKSNNTDFSTENLLYGLNLDKLKQKNNYVNNQDLNTDVLSTDVVGSDVVGSDVVGSDVVGSDVVGSDVVGSDVVGSDVVGSDDNVDLSDKVYTLDNTVEQKFDINDFNSDSNIFNLENVRVLIGHPENSKHGIYWEFGSSKINNRHLLIQGASGSGKSYFIQKILKELSDQGIPSIIIDYTDGFKKSKLEPEFLNVVESNLEQYVVFLDKFPLNPFKKYMIEFDGDLIPENDVTVAGRFKDIISSVYKFGSRQQMAIYDATLNGLRKYGNEMDLTKFKDELINQNTSHADTVLNKLIQFLEINPFKTEDFNWSCLEKMDGKIRIIQLTALPQDIQNIITEFILWDLWNYKKNSGDVNHPFIVVLDEAQNLDFSNKDSPCNKILKEGRKFGWSGWFATQFLKGAMKSEEINTLENANEKIYFHPTDNAISDVANNLAKDNNDKQYWEQKLSQLGRGQCIVHGYMKNNNGEIGPSEPVCVNIDNITNEKNNSNLNIIKNNKDYENNSNSFSTEQFDLNNIDPKYIRKSGNDYIICKTIDGKREIYGSFDNLFDAIKRRDELVSENWGKSLDETPLPGRKSKYGKYIIFHDGVYKINKFIEGKQRYIGSFKTLKEAEEYRNYLVENNWDLNLLPENLLEDKRVRNIRKIEDRYIVLKVDEDTKEYFGTFDTYDEAKEYLDYLIENNWKIDEFSEEKIDEYVYYVDDEYVVKNEIKGELKIFGRFDNIGDAINFRNECVLNNWDIHQ